MEALWVSTPSTLNLAPGKQEIVVKKTGYQGLVTKHDGGDGGKA